jgi:hypothetical protein
MADVAYTFRPNLDALLRRDECVSAIKRLLASPQFRFGVTVVIASPDFEARLDRLARILTDVGVCTVDRGALKNQLFVAGILYGTLLHFSAMKVTVDELRDPLAQAIEILKRGDNRAELLAALGAPICTPTEWGRAAHDAAAGAAAERFDFLVDGLQKLTQRLSAPPSKRRRGRPAGKPPATQNLEAVVDLLAQYWEQTTGTTFTQDWVTNETGKEKRKRTPTSPGATFVYEIFGFIDSGRLSKLPAVTRSIVEQRTCGK